MTNAPHAWPAAFALIWPFAGCSLMNLDDFGVGPCTMHSDCEGARKDFPPVPERCGDYRCIEGLCTWQDGRESCNGKDDDCNGAIDDNVSVSPWTVKNTGSAPTVVAYATAPDSTATYVVMGGAEMAQGLVLEGTSAGKPGTLQYASKLGTTGECPTQLSNGSIGSATCNFEDVALAVDAKHVIYAALNSYGCAAGQLRIGLAQRTPTAAFTVWLGTRPDARVATSSIETGVDLDAMGRCSGASSMEPAQGTPAAPGARSPAVASIDTTPGAAGALAVWLSASRETPAARCTSVESKPVQALAVFVPKNAEGWLEGSDHGRPLELGRSTSLAAPAVIALDWPKGSASYVVAFATEREAQRGVALLRVEARANTLKFTDLHFIEDEAPDQIILASAVQGSSAPELGIAWVSGCGSDGAIKFATLSGFQRTPKISSTVAIPIGDLAFKPALLHGESGFHEGSRAAGWYLLWAEQAATAPQLRVELARFTDELAPQTISQVTLSEGSAAFPLLYRSARSLVNHGLLRLGSEGEMGVEAFEGWCGDRG